MNNSLHIASNLRKTVLLECIYKLHQSIESYNDCSVRVYQ